MSDPGPWRNYHGNISWQAAAVFADRRAGPEMFRASARHLRRLLRAAREHDRTMAVIGSGWSLSSLLGKADCRMETDGLDALARVERTDLAEHSPLDPARCLFALGGVKLHQLAYYAELKALSISTCGSYLEQSLAGSLATGVIGSRLHYGGVQNMVRGLHLIGGSGRPTWLEPASRPALSDAAAATLASTVIRDDDLFDAALVHLGGMGIVNGVLLEMEPEKRFGVVRQRQQIDPAWLAAIEQGRFDEIARRIGHDAEPAYYEVQVDMFDPFGTPALHTLFFEEDTSRHAATVAGYAPSLGAIAAMVAGAAGAGGGGLEEGGGVPDDIFAVYSDQFFHPTSSGGQPEGALNWRELHSKRADPALKGLIYTSAFAVDRAAASRVIALCSARYRQLESEGCKRHMLFTLRFVTGAQGTMAFTTFPESMVVDMEGLAISPDGPRLGLAATAELATQGVPFRMHWGKLQEPDAAMVEQAFGPAAMPDSPIARWRAARNRLVAPRYRRLLANPALSRWGLIEQG